MKYLKVVVFLVFMAASSKLSPSLLSRHSKQNDWLMRTFSVIISIDNLAMALQCYQCDSMTNAKCGEEFEEDDSMKYDCSRVSPPRFLQTLLHNQQNATGCMKKTMEPGKPKLDNACHFIYSTKEFYFCPKKEIINIIGFINS